MNHIPSISNHHKEMRKLFLIAVPLLSVLTLLFNYIIIDQSLAYLTSILLGIIGLGYIYQNGIFRHMQLGRFLFLSIAVIIVGALFKLQHWPYGSILFILGVAIAAIIYSAHFIKKPAKYLLDWLKVFFVIMQSITIIFRFSHWPYTFPIGIISTIAFFILISYYYWLVIKNKEITYQKEDTIDYTGNNIFK